MLYRAEAFEPLTDEPWRERRVAEAIREVADDAAAAFDPNRLWPAEDWDGWMAAVPLKGLYVGAAGAIHALDVLRRRDRADSGLDLADAAARTLAAFRDEPDYQTGIELPSARASGLLSGETGILLVAWRLAPDDELERDLLARVGQNVDNEADELMWGTPGTLLAARALLDRTGADRWREAWRASADALWRRRDADGLWTQRLYGEEYRGLGPAHGAVGNVLALLGGGELLADERREILLTETAGLLAGTAVVEDGLANWPYADGRGLVGGDGEIRVQWCCGAPGIVISAAPYLDEELLLAGAELVWRAGPAAPEKGPGICHGTAAGGYALLAAFGRTGDERWLERARAFAVHALDQVHRARAARGRGRYSLWTGDLGVALFAADCLDARTAYPVTGSWD